MRSPRATSRVTYVYVVPESMIGCRLAMLGAAGSKEGERSAELDLCLLALRASAKIPKRTEN